MSSLYRKLISLLLLLMVGFLPTVNATPMADTMTTAKPFSTLSLLGSYNTTTQPSSLASDDCCSNNKETCANNLSCCHFCVSIIIEPEANHSAQAYSSFYQAPYPVLLGYISTPSSKPPRS